jgi:trimethylamine---corrinoid protein Co-methyltransferase
VVYVKRNQIAGRSSYLGCGLTLFSDQDLEMIHDATLEVLEYAGLYVQSSEAMDIYDGGGCVVDRDSRIVKIPSHIVEDAIRTSPKKVFLAGRDPRHDLVLENGRVNFCPFGEGVMVIDPYTGEYRKSTKKDKGDVARLVDALDQYDMLENTVAPRDVHPELESLHNYEVTAANTTKHVPQPCHDKRSAQLLIDMAVVVAGSKENLMDRPIVSGCTCPQSPLTISAGCAEPIIEYARANLPQNILSMALAGATSPVTLAGTLVTHNAEVLGGIVLAQLTRRGAPVIYGSSTSMIDLKLTTATVGCPELGLISAAVAKMAQMYLIPSYVAGT